MNALRNITAFVFFLCVCGLASASTIPYYVDGNGNTWINVSGSTGTEYYTVNNTGGSPSGVNTFPVYDNFATDGGVLNSNLWSTQNLGSGSESISNGALVIDGTPLSSTAGNVISKYNFTGGSELVLNQSLSNGYYGMTSFGQAPIISYGGNFYPGPNANGGMFLLGGLSGALGYRDSGNPTVATTPTYTYNTGSLGSNGVTVNTPFTAGYSYDASGNASVSLYTASYPNTTINSTKISAYDYSGYSQDIHPDVYFNNTSAFLSVYHHAYWMANTPYYHSIDSVENPQLLCSDDGINWVVPANVTEPIAPAPNNTWGHDDDTDMIFNTTSGKLEIYYLVTQRSPYNATVQQRTFDGVTVSGYTNLTGITPFEVSPAFIRNADGSYDSWCVNLTNSPKLLYHYTSTDGINWGNQQTVNFTTVPGMDIWHFNAQPYNGGYVYMMTFCTAGASGSGAKLYIGTSATAGGYITTQNDKPLIDIGQMAFDNNEVYRSCSMTDGTGIDVWYSGDDLSQNWNIAYAYITQNSTGYWSLNPLSASSMYSAYVNSIPTARCIIAQTGSGAQTHTSGNKAWMISQGEYTSSGYGGARTIYTAWVRNTLGKDSSVTFNNANGLIVMSVTPTVTNGYAQIEIPFNVFTASQTMDIEPIVAPTAAFTNTNTSNVFSLTDTSVGNPTSWLWDFGDNQTSTAENPIHTYMANGTFTVQLTVTNLAGFTQIAHSVTVTVPVAHAGFAYTNNSNVFTFTDISTNTPTSWAWDFGDGNTATVQNPAHTYAANGTYNITLTATNTYGSSQAIQTVTVYIPGVPPTPSPASQARTNTGQTTAAIFQTIAVIVPVFGALFILRGLQNGTIPIQEAAMLAVAGTVITIALIFGSFICASFP